MKTTHRNLLSLAVLALTTLGTCHIARNGAFLGANRDTIDKAINQDLDSLDRTGIENNPVLIKHTKDHLGLPDVRGANVEDLVDGAANIDVAGGDRTSANAWQNFNAAKLGGISANQFVERVNPGMGLSRGGDPNQTGDQNQPGHDGLGSSDGVVELGGAEVGGPLAHV